MKGLYELQVKLIQLKTQIVLREAHVLNILTFLISYLTFFKIINLPGMQTSTPQQLSYNNINKFIRNYNYLYNCFS